MAVELASAFVTLVPSAQGITEKLAKELGAPLEAAARAHGDKASDGLFSSFASKAATVGKVAAVGLTAAFAGVVAGGGALLKVGSEFDKAFDTIRVGTGATGEVLKGLQGDFKKVFTAVPTDMASASTAIADLNTRLGLTGQPLQDVSTRMLELTRITGADLSQSIVSASRVFGDWGVATDQQAGTLDKLFRASQATGPSVDRLSQLLVQFGAPMRQLGFSFEESAALLGKFEKEGVNTELVMGSMRIALGKMAREGEPAAETLQRTFEAIQNAGSASEANAIALELFGARAGPDMAAAIREGRFELGDLLNTVANGSETILGAAADTQSFSEKWTLFKNRVLVGVQPLATKLFDALGVGMDRLVPIAEQVFGSLAATIGPFFKTLSSGFTENEGTSIERFALTVRDAFAQIVDVGRRVASTFRGINWGDVFDQVLAVVLPLGAALANLASAGFEVVRAVAADLFDLFNANKETIARVALTVKDVLAVGANAAAAAFRFLADNFEAVKAVAIPLMVAFAAYKTTLLVTATATKAVALATKAWTAVQVAFNAVMALNPITLVVVALAALVAGVIYAYTHFEGFRNVVDTVGRAIAGVAQTIWGSLVTAFNWVRDNWPLLLAILAGPVGAAALLIITHWDTIRDAATAVVGWVAARFVEFVTFFVDLPGRILSAVADAAKWLVGTGVDVIAGLVNGYLSAIGAVTKFFAGLAADVLKWVGNAAVWLVGKGRDIITGLASGFSSVLVHVYSFFSGLAGQVVAWVGNAAVWLVGKGRDVVYGFIDGVYSVLGAVVSAVAGLGTTILNGVGNLSSVLYNTGQAVIRGFINGITSMFGSVRSTLGDLTGSLTSWKGPPSVDKKLLYGSGQLVMTGFMDGIDSKTGDLRSQLGDVTKMVGVGVGAGVADVAAPPQFATAGGLGAERPIHTHVYIDRKEIALAVESYQRSRR